MELLLSRLAYECIRYAIEVPTGTDFLYADYCNRTFEYNSDFSIQSEMVWGRINTALGKLYSNHKVSTFIKEYPVVKPKTGMPYVVLDSDVGEVLNVVDFSMEGGYTNFSFRRNRIMGENKVEDRVTIVSGIVGNSVVVEYYRQPKRFGPEDIKAVTETEDTNINLADYGITPAGFDYAVAYVEAKITELIDPVISARKQAEADSILTSINQEPKFSQDHVGTYYGGVY